MQTFTVKGGVETRVDIDIVSQIFPELLLESEGYLGAIPINHMDAMLVHLIGISKIPQSESQTP